MFVLCVRGHFSASHQLDGDIYSECCKRNHGHNYEYEVAISTPTLDSTGMVIDTGFIKNEIDCQFDHQFLNKVPLFESGLLNLKGPLPTTAEVIAMLIAC